MSKYVVQDFEEEDEQLPGTVITQSSNDSPNPLDNGADQPTQNIATTSKKKRNLPGNPDPDAEVVALSPRTLMATNRYICEVCHKGFQRDQNLQLHRRGHNLPWKLKQRPTTQVKKRVYVCPEPSCVHHDPSRALGDLTGIKKHFCRKHGEKKWKCDKCSKRYAVQSDWKAHTKICGTREYRCDCGTIFSRKDTFVTHRAFCDALIEENNKMNQTLAAATGGMLQHQAQELFPSPLPVPDPTNPMMNLSISHANMDTSVLKPLSLNAQGLLAVSSNVDPIFSPNGANPRTSFSTLGGHNGNSHLPIGSAFSSATALLQKAAEMGAKISDNSMAPILLRGFSGYSTSNMNTSNSIQEGSSAVGGQTSGGVPNSLYMRNLDAYGKSTEAGIQRINSFSSSQSGGLYDPNTLLMHSSNGTSGILSDRDHVLMGGSERLTLDFLGVEPAAAAAQSSFAKKRRLEGDVMGLDYSKAQQNLHHLHSDW
ncbi:protein indeterminate-domain 7-like [Coffea arabica]|uniref:Protein indeterminate-domain 7-like n=1 Tax=Coffea arabica TaxID=13443 RepID=A0A6P6WZ58_COFAR|nr:zinc finger protein GAI-ASSOCIATED FACTOR 1-like [Coffea arabica]